MAPEAYKVLILGGGIAGLATALALTKFSSAKFQPTIEVYEIRPEPGTVGGAMRLTPNALRVLDHLGVYEIIRKRRFGIPVNSMEVFSINHSKCLAEVSFRGPKNEGMGNPPYKVCSSNSVHTN
jgi:salicylate hydroxylase